MTTGLKPVTLGIIVGNRGFFPDHLCNEGRTAILQALAAEGIQAVALSPEETKFGSVETLADARRCAELFARHRGEIDGVLVTLPNFGDERGVANSLRWADLNVPVLVHAFPDEPGQMTTANRRDSFCGKISVCNNLHQYGIPFSLTQQHTLAPDSPAFHADLRWFAGVCRVVRGLRRARVGMIGARPAAFNTVRFSEKVLERAGISVETLDLSEVFGRAARIKDGDPALVRKLEEVRGYVPTSGVPSEALVRMAKLGAVVDAWADENGLQGTAIQCWTAMQEFYGIVPCTLMSMMSNRLMPSACETDILGVLAMYALALASGRPSAILDWNNSYGDDPDKAVVFHCSNLPKDMLLDSATQAEDGAVMDFNAILAQTLGREITYGTVSGRMRPGPFTFARLSTDESRGTLRAYVGEGRVTNDPLRTFGGFGVVHVPRLQKLLRYVCEHGFEHHVALTLAECASVVEEAFGKYLGWQVYRHET
jgi:L-fucose isomerase-like protein